MEEIGVKWTAEIHMLSELTDSLLFSTNTYKDKVIFLHPELFQQITEPSKSSNEN